ncbi:pyridoxamine 5'-phosphate oxidase family protein [Aquipuribacter sp. MA13-6]|uniref:pyridoxamine 5'-phosphate oxidase family protein n=1 Tax=unclassified Aquipuribacter TaxID=2635084 RepID=UPI003EF0075F
METTTRPPVELSESECWVLLREAMVGRLAVSVDDEPDVFPVNHVVDHGTLVFRTAEGTKLSAAAGRRVAFEIDGYDPASGQAWSVVVKGRAREVTELYDVLDTMGLPLSPWHASPKPRFVRVEPTTVTGRRFHTEVPRRT